jgi:hypothetical protein
VDLRRIGPMLKHTLIAASALVLGSAVSARAAEGDNKPQKEKVVVVEKKNDAEKKTTAKTTKVEVKEERGGNKFTNFWVHTVGGTIGNGLKGGASKISNAFD